MVTFTEELIRPVTLVKTGSGSTRLGQIKLNRGQQSFGAVAIQERHMAVVVILPLSVVEAVVRDTTDMVSSSWGCFIFLVFFVCSTWPVT